ncbi:MAG TPA: hypothetical protein VK638_37875 [Edaphobacter sp.]|nr:hypothetical protein [Edaphobacter sp.]
MSMMSPFLHIAAASADALVKLRVAEAALSQTPQVNLSTEHILHGGMYARTIRLAPGVIITGALIKIATVLVFSGHADVLIGDEWAEFNGYGVIAASAGRKQAFVTRSNVELTMIFPTQAKTVEEAEAEFTDEANLLLSRRSTRDIVVITGE